MGEETHQGPSPIKDPVLDYSLTSDLQWRPLTVIKSASQGWAVSFSSKKTSPAFPTKETTPVSYHKSQNTQTTNMW